VEAVLIFDIIILIILVLTMVFGFRRGFVYSFMHTLGLIGSLVAAFLFRKPVQGLISDNTMLDENFYNTIFENVASSLNSVLGPADTLPLILTDKINSAADDTAAMIAQNLTDFALQIISFFAIFIVVKLLCYIIISIFSRRNNEGFVGFFDGLLGLIAGFIKGILITFVFLALLAPGMNLMSPASAEIFMTALDNSYIAKTLYDANFLLLVLGF
jgi:uncharacterized membrane protein required for colicin V production